jgi:hypothetical protein
MSLEVIDEVLIERVSRDLEPGFASVVRKRLGRDDTIGGTWAEAIASHGSKRRVQ